MAIVDDFKAIKQQLYGKLHGDRWWISRDDQKRETLSRPGKLYGALEAPFSESKVYTPSDYDLVDGLVIFETVQSQMDRIERELGVDEVVI